MVVMPMPIFLVGSDLAPLEQRMDQVSAGLTAWQPTIKDTGVQTPPPVTIDANGYESAFDQFNRMCLASNWGDGLPLIPPTEERVQWILRGAPTGMEASLGKIMPRGGIADIGTIASALAMAGGRPPADPARRAAAAHALRAPERRCLDCARASPGAAAMR